MKGLEREIDGLFALPLAGFTAARNALARDLRAAGEKDAAARVQALAKPALPVWAINQASRNDPKATRALLAAGDALRKAQRRLLERGGSVEALRAALDDEREAIATFTDSARAFLEEGGGSATQATLDRARRTLEAAAVDEEGRELLKAGRLTTELEPAGFEALAGFQPVARERPALDELAERRRRRDEMQAARRALQQRVRELEQAARQAEREAERAAAAADDARTVAAKARAAADDAAVELANLDAERAS